MPQLVVRDPGRFSEARYIGPASSGLVSQLP